MLERLEELRYNAPCPNCKAQLKGGHTRRTQERVLFCEGCREAFTLADKRLQLSKK